MRCKMQTLMGLAALVGLSVVTATAQETKPNRPSQTGSAEQRDTPDRYQANKPAGDSNVGQLDSKTFGSAIRVSQLIGMNLENSLGDSVGEIQDIVIDAHTGKVRYAAVTYGGFLNLGDKLFAVPFEAFKVQRQQGDPDDFVMILNVSKSQLEGAKGFDQDHWPDMADPQWAADLDQRYGVNRDLDAKDRLRRANRDK